ncbi:hypothetical protein [Rhodoferax sp.]|uniref:hypothetical protein n=1 Tax=Rhodoferax sp. TaxID=50421 RepID=UPI0028433624|nr:hypothetical protein [Rhodoferax sp.]MDR3368868.1 hypothetical protein [Rhodoferax sp.]
MSFQLSLMMGLAFGVLAALLAFVNIYEAYRRQQLPVARIWRESLRLALLAFAVFMASSVILG